MQIVYKLKATCQDEYTEVTRLEFAAAERRAGFYPNRFDPKPDHISTAGFNGPGTQGRIENPDRTIPSIPAHVFTNPPGEGRIIADIATIEGWHTRQHFKTLSFKV